MNWIKYSGVWFGIVVNPFHWQFGWKRSNDAVFENAIHVGPVWIRVVLDNGQWS